MTKSSEVEQYDVWLAFNPQGEKMNLWANTEAQCWHKVCQYHIEPAKKEYYRNAGYVVRKFVMLPAEQSAAQTIMKPMKE